MKNKWINLLVAAICAAQVTTATLAADADAPKAPAAAAKKPSGSTYPFRGTVESVSVSARTITLEGKKAERVLHVTNESTFEKDGKPAKLEEVAPGDYAKGLLTRPEGNREVVVKATLGPKPDRKGRQKPATPADAPKESAANR
jgi:hypothetical protein